MDKERMTRLAKIAIKETFIPRRFWAVENFRNYDWTLQLQTDGGTLAEEVKIEVLAKMTDEEIIAAIKQELLKKVSSH
jgi:hypothetical protein